MLMKLFYKASQKLLLGLSLSFLTSPAFAAEQTCNDYYIQVMATASSGKAYGMKVSFKKAGYNTSVMPFKGSSGPIYRVRTGPYSSAQDASQTHQTMKKALHGNSMAQGSIIISNASQCHNVAPAAKPLPAFASTK